MNAAFFKLPQDKQNRILSAGIAEFSVKSYAESNTDSITKACEISKGLLFHYFGSKKAFYLFCVEQAIRRLVTTPTPTYDCGDFYDILFSGLDEKVKLCKNYPDEMHLINMASRENHTEVAEQKNKLLQAYMADAKRKSLATYGRALSTLSFKQPDNQKVTEALMLYTNTIINKYLTRYQNTPDVFFEQIDSVKQELQEYLSFLLDGICK